MSSGLPIYANTKKGKIFTGVLTSEGVYEQMARGEHFYRPENSRGMDMSIYELLLSNHCRSWRVTHLNLSTLIMPFSKIATLLEAGIAKKVKYPGFDQQLQIPLEYFNNEPTPGFQKPLL